MEETKLTPIFEVGQQLIKESFNPKTPVTISDIDDTFYYTEEGIIIAIETQEEWKKYGEFKTDDEVLIPGKIVRASGDSYYVTFPWAYTGTKCTCLGDEWIVPKKEGDKMFQILNTKNNA